MTELIVALQLGTLAIVGWHIYSQRHGQYAIDAERVAQRIAEQILTDYAADLDLLDEDGTRKFTRNRYLRLCSSLGLPGAAIDDVEYGVWDVIRQAQAGNSAGESRGNTGGLYG